MCTVTNKGRGCEWQGEVDYIDNHLKKDGHCDHKGFVCTSGCSGLMQRQNLTKHVETEFPRYKVTASTVNLEEKISL